MHLFTHSHTRLEYHTLFKQKCLGGIQGTFKQHFLHVTCLRLI